ncbi:MAG TPA: hypothetical protein VJN65_01685 [Bacteroidota bacterium]|nr:hypothetical protein [Bacteroidota bacterium]
MGVQRVLLFFSLSSFVSSIHAQVIIKERVIIDPKPQIQLQAFSVPSGPLLRLRGNILETTMPGVVVSGALSTMPSSIPENTGYEVWVSVGASSHLVRKAGTGYCIDAGGTESSPFPATLPKCGVIGMSAFTFVPAPWQWSCAIRGTAIDTPIVSSTGATITARGTLWYTSFTATLTVTAILDESYLPSQVVATPQMDSLACSSATGVDVTVLDGHGNPYTDCGGSQLTGTATIQAKGDYAYLEGNGQSGKSVQFNITNGRGAFFAVLDTSKGIVDGGSDVAQIQVQVEGRVGTTSITMSCDYPPPTVAITYPGSDTTITLSPGNLPDIIFRETHSPGRDEPFEPSISWTPGPVLSTKEYFESIQDTLVIPVKVKATSVGGSATDELEIILKKGCNLAPPHYRQGDTLWAKDTYDSTEVGIKTLGCALTCIAMAMTAFGDTVRPGQLNEWMKGKPTGQGGFSGALVNWDVVQLHGKKGINYPAKDVDTNFVLSTFDAFLQECELIIVKVFNPETVKNKSPEEQERAKTKGNHWVLVRRKTGSEYAILDPGGRGLTQLSGYGRIYRYVRVTQN